MSWCVNQGPSFNNVLYDRKKLNGFYQRFELLQSDNRMTPGKRQPVLPAETMKGTWKLKKTTRKPKKKAVNPTDNIPKAEEHQIRVNLGARLVAHDDGARLLLLQMPRLILLILRDGLQNLLDLLVPKPDIADLHPIVNARRLAQRDRLVPVKALHQGLHCILGEDFPSPLTVIHHQFARGDGVCIFRISCDQFGDGTERLYG